VHQQHIADTAIHRIASVEDDFLEANVGSVNCGVEVVHHHEVCSGPMLGVDPIPIPLRQYESFSKVHIPKQQLRHLQWLASVHSMDNLH
jgi:hypothetical protein